jgi:hypothetical protein
MTNPDQIYIFKRPDGINIAAKVTYFTHACRTGLGVSLGLPCIITIQRITIKRPNTPQTGEQMGGKQTRWRKTKRRRRNKSKRRRK